jgi:hypothetical protein
VQPNINAVSAAVAVRSQIPVSERLHRQASERTRLRESARRQLEDQVRPETRGGGGGSG